MEKQVFESKKALVSIHGGLGKNVSFAHLIPEVLTQYSEIGVITPYTDVFDNIDKVTVYNGGDLLQVKAAFEDFKDAEIVIDHMYDLNDFIKKRLTYADAWRVLLKLKKVDNAKLTPKPMTEVIKTDYLKPYVDKILEDLKEKGFEKFIITQHTGGQSPLVQVPKDEKGNALWNQVPYNQNSGLSRHYPTDKFSTFVGTFKSKHPDIAVISYTLPNEPFVEGTIRYEVPYLVYRELAKKSEGIVTIDSSLQHMTADLNKPTVVIWGHTDPHTFGYEGNNNIVQNCNRENIHYFTALGPSYNKIDYISPEKLADVVEETLFKKE